MIKKKTFLSTSASHKSCFICKKKHSSKNRLKVVNENLRLDYFKRYNIFIRKDSRSCKNHFQRDGSLSEIDFLKAQTFIRKNDNQFECFLKHNVKKKIGIFEEFEDIDNLKEEHCKTVTGWSKKKFIEFSKYITSINESKSRSKHELIALYRYWLRKGIDQTTLAFLFGKNTSQNEISNYLSQIRTAINNDFVNFYLGSNRKREFFLKHNNIMAKELHDLNDDILTIVADGTYCRLEKSANNNFQYCCWSGQKKDLLIKPFVICCADGYIIDLYGPFEAFENDSSILSIILEKDKELLNILQPGKTCILLDRGK